MAWHDLQGLKSYGFECRLSEVLGTGAGIEEDGNELGAPGYEYWGPRTERYRLNGILSKFMLKTLVPTVPIFGDRVWER